MGNTPSPQKKRRVTWASTVAIDRYEEDTKRFEHIVKMHSALDKHDVEAKDKLATLIIKYLERCHSDVNVTAEIIHYERVKTVCIIALETFQAFITEQQVRALHASLFEYVLLDV
tara:strand:+ start:943 stop:1287 length:345 start_codon:yes stop_codon:yes gene_type:complete